jgi:hypothetical protein
MRRIVITVLCLIGGVGAGASDGYYSVLYGFKLGQPIANAIEVLGEPAQIQPFPDGWKAYVFPLQGHNLVFEANVSRPDLIFSIQIEGSGNPQGLGLGAVNLGDPLDVTLGILGQPDRQQPAMDALTQQPVEGAATNFYGRGMSFDQRDGVVTSIKIIYGGPAALEPIPNIERFFTRLRNHDYYGLAEMIATDMTIAGRPAVVGSMLGSIAVDSPLHELLYGQRGLASMSTENDAGGGPRTYEDGRAGFAIQLVDRSVAELVFTRSFEGWVLWQANPPPPEPEPEIAEPVAAAPDAG